MTAMYDDVPVCPECGSKVFDFERSLYAPVKDETGPPYLDCVYRAKCGCGCRFSSFSRYVHTGKRSQPVIATANYEGAEL